MAHAATLWTALDGYNSWPALPGHEGVVVSEAPHGGFVSLHINDTAGADTTNFAMGSIIVKNNYADEMGNTLEAVTVMERREGFNAEGGNWFWAKYLPDGTLDESGMGIPLAGAVTGCVNCHSAESDWVFRN